CRVVDSLHSPQYRASHQHAARGGEDNSADRRPTQTIDDKSTNLGLIPDISPDQQMKSAGQRDLFDPHSAKFILQKERYLVPARFCGDIGRPFAEIANNRLLLGIREQINSASVCNLSETLVDHLYCSGRAFEAKIIPDRLGVGANNGCRLAFE